MKFREESELNQEEHLVLQAFRKTIEQASADKKNWGDGEWQYEPDFMEFKYKGYHCSANRDDSTGTWGGCITLPQYDKYHDKKLQSQLKAHGGLLIHGNNKRKRLVFLCCNPFEDFYPTNNAIIMVLKQMAQDEEHFYELLQNFKSQLPDGSTMFAKDFDKGTYKNVAFVVKELKALVDQLV